MKQKSQYFSINVPSYMCSGFFDKSIKIRFARVDRHREHDAGLLAHQSPALSCYVSGIQARDQVLQRTYRQASFEQLIHVNNFTPVYRFVGVWWRGDFTWWRQQEIRVTYLFLIPLFV